MSPMELPDRSGVLRHVDALVSARPATVAHGRVSDARPAVCVVIVEGYQVLAERDPTGTEAAMGEVVRRIDRLVRANDLLGTLGPGRFALVAHISPAVAGALAVRIAGAVAMPLDLAGESLSLPVTVGMAFLDPPARDPSGGDPSPSEGAGPYRAVPQEAAPQRAVALLLAAERDAELQQARRASGPGPDR